LCLSGPEAVLFDQLAAKDALRHKQETLEWKKYTSSAFDLGSSKMDKKPVGAQSRAFSTNHR
jgi:hypothetical protein